MSDMTREVYKDKADVMVTLNPFVEMPRMRVDTLNRLNELIKRDQALPIVKDGYDEWDGHEKHKKFACPSCECRTYEDYNFCPYCGQRLDTENYAL